MGRNTHIYMITNCKNGMKYIGRTCANIKTRLQQHFADNRYVYNNCPLHKDMKLYKKEDFKIETIYEKDFENFHDADTIELKFIEYITHFILMGIIKGR